MNEIMKTECGGGGCPLPTGSAPRGGIEDELDRLAEKLPDGYEVQICVENGAAWLQVVEPSGETVPIDGDCETCWGMLMGDALMYCLTHSEEKGQGHLRGHKSADNEK